MAPTRCPALLRLLVVLLALPAAGGAQPPQMLRLPYPREAPGYRPVGLLRTADGFLLGGEVESPETGWDLSLLRLSANLVPGEHRVLSGDRSDGLVKIRAVDPGLFLLANTSSRTGDLSARYGIQDLSLLRLGGRGEVLWSRAFGGPGLNQAREMAVDQASGAVTVLGWVNGAGGTVPRAHGELDVAVARYDRFGELQWVTVLGEEGDDLMGSLAVEGERAWVLYSGWSRRNRWEMHLVQLDGDGRVVRRSRYGTRGSELSAGIARLDGGDLLLLGTTDAEEGTFGPPRGKTDILLLRVNDRGRIRWRARFGGSEAELAQDLLAVEGGGCWVLGMTQSGNGDVRRHLGGSDLLLLEISPDGALLDSRTYGTADEDLPLQILPGQKGPLVLGSVRISESLSEPFLIHGGREQ